MNGGDGDGFAAWVRGLRRRLGLTQGELGKRVGVGQMAVSKWELGKTVPLAATRARLAEMAEGTGLGPPPEGEGEG